MCKCSAESFVALTLNVFVDTLTLKNQSAFHMTRTVVVCSRSGNLIFTNALKE